MFRQERSARACRAGAKRCASCWVWRKGSLLLPQSTTWSPLGSPFNQDLTRDQLVKGGARCPTALRFDQDPIAESSPAGMTGATADGRPTTSARSCSTRNATPNQYAVTCAICARAMPSLSTLNRPMLGLELARTILASFRRAKQRLPDVSPGRLISGQQSIDAKEPQTIQCDA